MLEICYVACLIMVISLALIAITAAVWFMRTCNKLIEEKKSNSNSWVDKKEP